jgi:hypothetical protein
MRSSLQSPPVANGKPLPDIFAFRHAFAPAPALNAPDRAEVEAQWRQLEAFVAQVFVTSEGYFKGALEPYQTMDEFEARVDRALRQWLAENVIKGRTFAWPVATKGSPFRGLEPFGASIAKVSLAGTAIGFARSSGLRPLRKSVLLFCLSSGQAARESPCSCEPASRRT